MGSPLGFADKEPLQTEDYRYDEQSRKQPKNTKHNPLKGPIVCIKVIIVRMS